jgi:hypothetical protein
MPAQNAPKRLSPSILPPPRGMNAGLLSWHNFDLAVLLVIWLAIFEAAIILTAPVFRDFFADVAAVKPLANAAVLAGLFALAVGIFVTGLLQIVLIAHARLATVDLFVSEISAIGAVFLNAKIVEGFGELLKSQDFKALGFSDAPRRSDYFEIFHSRCQDLGALSYEAVFSVTAFYTNLKASRDAIQSIEAWNRADYPATQKRQDIIATLVFCREMAHAGSDAIHLLVETAKLRRDLSRPFDLIARAATEALAKGDNSGE